MSVFHKQNILFHKSFICTFVLKLAYSKKTLGGHFFLTFLEIYFCNNQRILTLRGSKIDGIVNGLKSQAMCQQLWSFLLLYRILCHYNSLSHSKSMPQRVIMILKWLFSYKQLTWKPSNKSYLKNQSLTLRDRNS